MLMVDVCVQFLEGLVKKHEREHSMLDMKIHELCMQLDIMTMDNVRVVDLRQREQPRRGGSRFRRRL